MARKLRVEFEGASYHVLNRGNYRRDLFTHAGEAGAFVTTLEECTAMYGWQIQAYAVMRNHYHLALTTPTPNLKDGMHWLQSTFATRFNSFHQERGHLFQGRYQSLVVENNEYMKRLVDYIHLNPVRAGIVAAAQVHEFRWSSLGRFIRGPRFVGLEPQYWLRASGLRDDAESWRTYLAHLHGVALDPKEQERLGFESMSRGWAIGTAGWRKALAKEHSHLALSPGLAASEARELREARWFGELNGLMREAGRSVEDAREAPKLAKWKLAVAARLRNEVGASVEWISSALSMGTGGSLRSALNRQKLTKMNKIHEYSA
jgi:putative transposase